jgi:DNA-binding transcriptional regulator YhcF (GntR family)
VCCKTVAIGVYNMESNKTTERTEHGRERTEGLDPIPVHSVGETGHEKGSGEEAKNPVQLFTLVARAGDGTVGSGEVITMDRGFLKLHRKILDWEWYTDTNVKSLFIHLLINANYTDKKHKGIEVKKGQFLTSRDKLALGTGLSVQSVRTALKKLEKSGEIRQKVTKQYTIITVCNYCRYNEQQAREQPTTNQQLTNNQPTANQQLTTTKKDKKGKKEKKNTPLPPKGFEAFWSAYPKKVGKKAALKSWEKATDKPPVDVIITAIALQMTSEQWTKDGGQYIPNPATWLNQGRWMDAVQQPASTRPQQMYEYVSGKPH